MSITSRTVWSSSVRPSSRSWTRWPARRLRRWSGSVTGTSSTRAVELAEGDVGGYRSDFAALQRDRQHSVQACLEAERQANERLRAARVMQARVHEAEPGAVHGVAVMVDKLAASREPEAST